MCLTKHPLIIALVPTLKGINLFASYVKIASLASVVTVSLVSVVSVYPRDSYRN